MASAKITVNGRRSAWARHQSSYRASSSMRLAGQGSARFIRRRRGGKVSGMRSVKSGATHPPYGEGGGDVNYDDGFW